MNANNFDLFESNARAAGFDEAVVREWDPDTVVETHAHPFDADAVVTKGEMWLTCGDITRHLKPGDTFTLASGTHSMQSVMVRRAPLIGSRDARPPVMHHESSARPTILSIRYE